LEAPLIITSDPQKGFWLPATDQNNGLSDLIVQGDDVLPLA